MFDLLVADDHRIFRQGVVRLLADNASLRTVAQAGSCEEAVNAARTHRLDLAIVDIDMPGRGGTDLVAHLKGIQSGLRVLVLTMYDEESYVTRAMRAGADGYLTKEHAADELLRAIDRVLRDEKYLCSNVAERVALGMVSGHPKGHPNGLPHASLSDREFKVFEMLVAGMRGRDIAEAMRLSEKTVSTHKAHLLRKMNVANGTELIRYALKNRLIKD